MPHPVLRTPRSRATSSSPLLASAGFVCLEPDWPPASVSRTLVSISAIASVDSSRGGARNSRVRRSPCAATGRQGPERPASEQRGADTGSRGDELGAEQPIRGKYPSHGFAPCVRCVRLELAYPQPKGIISEAPPRPSASKGASKGTEPARSSWGQTAHGELMGAHGDKLMGTDRAHGDRAHGDRLKPIQPQQNQSYPRTPKHPSPPILRKRFGAPSYPRHGRQRSRLSCLQRFQAPEDTC